MGEPRRRHARELEMDGPFFETFLRRRGGDGSYPCPCGMRHRINAGRIVVEKGALGVFPSLVSERFGSGCRLWILSDRNTETAAGLSLKKALGSFRVNGVVLPDLKPQPTLETVLELERHVKERGPDLLVAVGGGTVSDMVKKISLDTGVENWCVPTCPSVDAYTSGTAAIWVRGYHTSLPSRGSEVVVCDLAVLESAPRELILSGLGDLLGKHLAHLDWHVSRLITGEPVCGKLADISLESAKRVFASCVPLAAGGEDATRLLIDALLTSGLVMQSVGSSRPAGSAEHTVAHFWEMAKAVRDERLDLHGILAGLAGMLAARAYGDFYRRLERVLDGTPAEVFVSARLEAFEREPRWDETLENAVLPYKFKMDEEMEGKGLLGGKALRDRLTRLFDHGDAVLDMARKRLAELEKAASALEAAGFPSSPSALGIRPSDALLPFRYVRFLRNRYSSFDLMHETGFEREILEALGGSISE